MALEQMLLSGEINVALMATALALQEVLLKVLSED